ncbi:cytochrome P-450 cyp509A1 [Hesseltinella vesiculosa]|uniref:Cytochrome P-450 cyp509A1 n=1 Tax=Hesseltinella vesiculosa TaxID=101127 RepID=A0A1X2GK42_9FUNG|nr:cytochrome P-450 cyp509A1 [Hesseltinella vesiculosa]
MVKKETLPELYESLFKPLTVQGHGVYVREEGSGWVVHISQPQAAKQILLKADMFPKSQRNLLKGTLFNYFLGTENIVTTTGHEWKKHRLIVNPAFHRSSPVKLFGELAKQMFTLWETKNPESTFTVDFGNWMERFTLDVIGQAGFGFEFDAMANENNYWTQVYNKLINDSRRPLYLMFPILDRHLSWLIPSRRAAFQNADKFLGMLKQIIEHKRKTLKSIDMDAMDECDKDLLTLMIESQLRGEGQLTDTELLNNLAIFFLAGHDTTAIALSSAVYWLARHPHIQEKARQEVNAVLFPDGSLPDEDVVPTLENTKQFIYLNQVIKEALRLGGPATQLGTPREAQKEFELAGTGVMMPKGTMFTVNIFELHHNPELWEDPYTFNPDRFEAGGAAEQNAGNGLAWTPFSNGTRQCVGMNMSLVEQRVTLAMLLRHYDISLPKDSIHRHGPVMKGGFQFKQANLQIEFKKRF